MPPQVTDVTSQSWNNQSRLNDVAPCVEINEIKTLFEKVEAGVLNKTTSKTIIKLAFLKMKFSVKKPNDKGTERLKYWKIGFKQWETGSRKT